MMNDNTDKIINELRDIYYELSEVKDLLKLLLTLKAHDKLVTVFPDEKNEMEFLNELKDAIKY